MDRSVIRLPFLAIGFALYCTVSIPAGTADVAGNLIQNADFEGKIDPEIPALKPLVLQTPLVKGGVPDGIIVCSSLAAHQVLAQRVVESIRVATGTVLPIRLDNETTEADWRNTHVIALGNLMTNRLIERLYCRWYVRTDAWYPGTGGCELRTVHDPWGTGKNVILLGGSGAAGVTAATDEFLKLVQPGRDLVLEPLLNIHLSPDLSREQFARSLDDSAVEKSKAGFKRATMRSLVARAGTYAFNYYASGDPRWATLYRDCVLEHRSRGELGDDTHMDLWYTLIGYDLVEECSALSDADRQDLTRYLLFLCRSQEGANKSWFLSAIRQNTIRHNHVMLAALDAFFGGEFFHKYYRLAEAAEWIENAAIAFRGQQDHSKTQCDANSYEAFAVSLAMTYALAKPDLAFFESGAARTATERLLRCQDNMLYSAAYGDSWSAFEFPRALVQFANWYYRNPRYQYVLDDYFRRTGRSRWGNNPAFAIVGPAEKPADLDGVQAIPVDPEFFTYSTRKWHVNVPLEHSFDKIAFRERFEPEAQYLLLDGLNIGSHGHIDANTIIEFSEGERFFLVDMSYTEGVGAGDHNGVTVIRNGLASEPVAGAELITCADLGTTAFTRSVLHEWGGCDWTRQIFWRKGKYFIVMDETRALESGDFNVQCHWRTLGTPALESDTFCAEQVRTSDVEMVPASAATPGADSEKVAVFRSREGALEFTVTLPAGKCAVTVFGKGVDSGSDSVWIDLDGTRIEQPFNLPTQAIGPSSAKWDLSEPTPNSEIAVGGPHLFRVSLRESPGVMLDRLEFVDADGQKQVVPAATGSLPEGTQGERRDTFVLCNAGGVEYELDLNVPGFGPYWKNYRYAAPEVNVLHQKTALHLDSGQAYTFVNLFYVSNTDQPREFKLTRTGDDNLLITGDEEAIAGIAGTPFTAGHFTVAAEFYHVRRDGFTLANGTRLDLGKPLLRSPQPVSVEFDLVTGEVTVCATEAVALRCLTNSRNIRVDDRDMALDAPEADGLVAVPVAKGRHRITGMSVPSSTLEAYRGTLAEAMTIMGMGTTPEIPRVVTPVGNLLKPAWEFTAAGAVNAVFPADVDGDGNSETVLGTGGTSDAASGGSIYLLDSTGAPRWYAATGGAVNTVYAADLDGDGQAEILAGGEDAVVHCLSAAGQPKWTFTCPPADNTIPYMHFGGRGAVKSLWAGILNQGTAPLVIACPQNGYTFGLSGNGEQLWKYRSGEGVFTSLAVADLQGSGERQLLGGSSLCSWCRVTVISGDGKGHSFRGLDGWAVNLTALATGDTDGDGTGEIVVGTSKNNVYYLNSKGEAKWKFTLGEAPSCLTLADLNGDGRQEIVVGSPSNYLYALDCDGKPVWTLNLGSEVTALAVAVPLAGKPVLMAGTKSGRLYQVSPEGRVVASLTAKGQMNSLAAVTSVQPATAALFVFGTAGGQAGTVAAARKE